MSPLEIALIIIGIAIIIISCILIDKNSKVDKQTVSLPFSFDGNVTEEDKKKLIERMNDLLTEISDETIIRTEDSLSKLSNEKIIAVSEFSDQILEKIKRNHDEVIFFYNMLNDKEKELKAAVKEIDASKKKVREIMESKSGAQKANADKSLKVQPTEKPVSQASGIEKSFNSLNTKEDAAPDFPVANSLSSNNNEQILAFYSAGKSVMEISKLLDLGQGEVKLVIDLFKGNK